MTTIIHYPVIVFYGQFKKDFTRIEFELERKMMFLEAAEQGEELISVTKKCEIDISVDELNDWAVSDYLPTLPNNEPTNESPLRFPFTENGGFTREHDCVESWLKECTPHDRRLFLFAYFDANKQSIINKTAHFFTHKN